MTEDDGGIRNIHLGLALGALAVCCFAITPTATRVAVADLDPLIVSAGRVLVAAILSAIVLAIVRPKAPSSSEWRSLVGVSLGVCVGFPIFTALAYKQIPASHGAIISALLPLVTAGMAVWRDRERPTATYWIASIIGAGTVLLFAFHEGAGALSAGDGWMILALFAAAYGYTEGARMSRSLGGWQTICWALILAGPLALAVTTFAFSQQSIQAEPRAWLGFAYLCVVSQLVGFFPWYKGMALAGISRVGQIQLAQAPLGVIVSAMLLGEKVNLLAIPTLIIVLAMIVIGARSSRKEPIPAES